MVLTANRRQCTQSRKVSEDAVFLSVKLYKDNSEKDIIADMSFSCQSTSGALTIIRTSGESGNARWAGPYRSLCRKWAAGLDKNNQFIFVPNGNKVVNLGKLPTSDF